LPILHGNRLAGGISVEISPLFVQTRLRDVFLDVLVLGLIATLVALELALAVTSVGKPLDRVFHLLGEQSGGDFRHHIRSGGLSGLGRTAARLNDHAEDLAARAAAIPEAPCSTIAARIPVGQPIRLRRPADLLSGRDRRDFALRQCLDPAGGRAASVPDIGARSRRGARGFGP